MSKLAPLFLVLLLIIAVCGCFGSSDDVAVGQVKVKVFGRDCGENVTLRVDDRVFYSGFVGEGVGVDAFTGNISVGVHLVSIEYRESLQEKRVVSVVEDECTVVWFDIFEEFE